MKAPVTDASVLDAYNRDALGFPGQAEGLYRPTDEKEVAEILRHCFQTRTRITPTALRSSTTGAAVCQEGFLLSTEKMAAIRSVCPERRIAVAEPGVNLGLFKRTVEEAGLLFPPDPTSEDDCTLGGAVATNASGARTLLYGPTRRWVRRLRAVLPDGSPLELSAARTEKNTAGYFGFQDPIQFFVGSEGTLGVITEIEVSLLPAPVAPETVLAFFRTEDALLRAVPRLRRSDLSFRCLEYFDHACLDLLRNAHGIALPAAGGGMLYLEVGPRPGETALLERCLALLESCGAEADATILGDTPNLRREIRAWRHQVPATLNERGAAGKRQGGGKTSTDWAVPFDDLAGIFRDVRAACPPPDLCQTFCFGHIGNGHPHFNFLADGPPGQEAARRAAHAMCRIAVAHGGTICAEHGVGKVKREYLRYMFPPEALRWMEAFKAAVDPRGVMAPGNIFPS